MTLIEQLKKKGVIDEKRAVSLEYEIKISGKKEEEVILEKQIFAEDLLFELKSKDLKIDLRKVSPEEISPKILELIPQEAIKYYKMIPLVQKGGILEVGMVYPEDIKAQEALNFLSRREKFAYKIFLITLTTFDNVLKQFKTFRKEVKKALEELESELKVQPIVKPSPKEAELQKMVEEAPIIKVVAVILRHAIERRSSDIHIEPTMKELRIRFRIDGILLPRLLVPLKIHPAVIARIKILSNLRIDETRIPQDGRFSVTIAEKNIDFRVSTFPTTLGEKAALRVLDPSEGIKRFEDLGLEGRNFNVVKKIVKRPHGLILITGPTGCGKTTTLYAILNLLNKEGVNIMTLEDPVEYFIKGINQSQTKAEIGYTFALGLRHMVRQDPDIIMVGEIRDEETASLAINAALTGHIVLSTLHTTNAMGVIPRLIDLGVAPFLIPSSLSLTMAQRLARKLCIHCRKKERALPKVKEMILEEIDSLPQVVRKKVKISDPLMIYTAKGCKKCRWEGYSGRTAIFEVLETTNELSAIILKEPNESVIFKEAQRQGMTTMKQDGILKVLDGIISIEEILRVI